MLTSLKFMVSADPETYPLQKKGHTLEFLREIAHFRPRTNTFGAFCESGMPWPLLFINILMIMDFIIFIRPLSQVRMLKVPVKCSG